MKKALLLLTIALAAASCKMPDIDPQEYRHRSESYKPDVFSKIDARELKHDIDSVYTLSKHHAAVEAVAKELVSDGKAKDIYAGREAAEKQPARVAEAQEGLSVWKSLAGAIRLKTTEVEDLFKSYDPALTIYFYTALAIFVLVFIPLVLRRFLRKPSND